MDIFPNNPEGKAKISSSPDTPFMGSSPFKSMQAPSRKQPYLRYTSSLLYRMNDIRNLSHGLRRYAAAITGLIEAL
jgi:hypothetical protein